MSWDYTFIIIPKKKNQLLKLHSTNIYTKKKREKLNEFTEEHIEVKKLIEKNREREREREMKGGGLGF